MTAESKRQCQLTSRDVINPDPAAWPARNPIASNVVLVKAQYGVDLTAPNADGKVDCWTDAVTDGDARKTCVNALFPGGYTPALMQASTLDQLNRIIAVRVAVVVRSDEPDLKDDTLLAAQPAAGGPLQLLGGHRRRLPRPHHAVGGQRHPDHPGLLALPRLRDGRAAPQLHLHRDDVMTPRRATLTHRARTAVRGRRRPLRRADRDGHPVARRRRAGALGRLEHGRRGQPRVPAGVDRAGQPGDRGSHRRAVQDAQPITSTVGPTSPTTTTRRCRPGEKPNGVPAVLSGNYATMKAAYTAAGLPAPTVDPVSKLEIRKVIERVCNADGAATIEHCDLLPPKVSPAGTDNEVKRIPLPPIPHFRVTVRVDLPGTNTTTYAQAFVR